MATPVTAFVEDLDIRDQVINDLAQANQQLAGTRAARRLKDTPAHRAAVQGALHRIDTLLDLLIDLTPGA